METAEARRQKVLDKLKEWNIGYVMHEHPPLPTIEEAMKYWKDFDSTHCKNLFFRNHKGNRHYLVILECHKQMDIHGLEHQLHQGKLSFASEQRMERCLGTVPGSVSLFGLINDPESPSTPTTTPPRSKSAAKTCTASSNSGAGNGKNSN